MKHLFKLTIAIIALTLSNCKKDTLSAPEHHVESTPETPTGSIRIVFEGMVGDSDLVLNTQTYMNQAGNTFNVTAYKYYITNIKFTKMDNSVFVESNSYHLIDYSDNSIFVTVSNLPYGNYKAIEFMIGVDSARNYSGAQTGALDPANGMFWNTSTGYIMAKMEGTSPQSAAIGQNLKFHIGGCNGTNNVLKTVSPSFNGDTAKVSATVSPEIHMANNLLEWFETPTLIDFSIMHTVDVPSASAKIIADNYADMFIIEHIHNN